MALCLSSCYTRRNVTLLQERDALPSYEQAEYQLYRLQANDEVEVRVITSNVETAALFIPQSQSTYSNTTQFNYPYRIYDDGTIDLPFLNNVHIMGLTIEEAEQKIQKLLVDFVKDASVKLSLSTGTFCVIGDAGRGYFSIYKDRLTIYQALALCGGINDSGKFSKVKILRSVGGESRIVEFDIRSKSVINSEYYYIYPNDIIYIDASKKRFWAVNSYSSFVSIIAASVNMLVSAWNTFR